MRILQLLAPGPFGGLERVVIQLLSGLAERGHRVLAGLIVEREQGEEPGLVDALRRAGVPATMVRPPHRAYRMEQRMVSDLLVAEQPQVVHTHGYHPDVLLRPVAQRFGLPVMSTVHGFTGGGPKNRLFEWLQRRSLREMNAVAAVSAPLAGRLIRSGVPASRVHVVPNAYAPPGEFLSRDAALERLGLAGDAKVIGWVGRMSPEKGPDVVVQALSRLGNRNARLCLIGRGRLQDHVKHLAARLGVADRVHWAGSVPDAWQYFKAFDVYCLSSFTEGTPMALLEAMAAGVPVVTTAVGGIPDVLGPAEAWLVPAGDSAALAASLDQALSTPEPRASAASLRLAQERALSPWLERYEAIYRSLIPSPARNA